MEKIWCRQKRQKFQDFLQKLVQADMKSMKKAIFQQKNHGTSPFVIKSVLESNCKRFRDTAIREIFNWEPDPQMKKTHSNNEATLFTNTMNKSSVSNFPLLCIIRHYWNHSPTQLIDCTN